MTKHRVSVGIAVQHDQASQTEQGEGVENQWVACHSVETRVFSCLQMGEVLATIVVLLESVGGADFRTRRKGRYRARGKDAAGDRALAT